MPRQPAPAGKPQGGVTLLITGLPAAGKTTLGKALAADRAEMRQLATRSGSFVEVYLSTPLAECERLDPKGLYARARSGDLKHMTGIDDPSSRRASRNSSSTVQSFQSNSWWRR